MGDSANLDTDQARQAAIVDQLLSKMDYEAIIAGIPANTINIPISKNPQLRSAVFRVIPPRTWNRRIQKRELLEPREADAIVRLLRVTARANHVFGDPGYASRWLELENPALRNHKPIQMAETDSGAREVEAVLNSFANGDYI